MHAIDIAVKYFSAIRPPMLFKSFFITTGVQVLLAIRTFPLNYHSLHVLECAVFLDAY